MSTEQDFENDSFVAVCLLKPWFNISVSNPQYCRFCLNDTFSMYMCVCSRWVFLYEKAYQIRDTAIESSVMTKVKGFGIYNDKVMDVADYVTPTQVWMDKYGY